MNDQMQPLAQPGLSLEPIDPRSQNAVKFGLFSTRDLVLAGEQSEYEELREALMGELLPEGALQEAFAGEIVSARWRLRRCGLIEASLVNFMSSDEYGFPVLNDEGEKRQRSADRARSQAQTSMRRSMAEFRKLQTERMIMIDMGYADDPHALFDSRAILSAIKTEDQIKANKMKEEMHHGTPSAPPADLFCKQSSTVPAAAPKVGPNAPCPCGSGRKYKKCCDSPEVHNQKYAA